MLDYLVDQSYLENLVLEVIARVRGSEMRMKGDKGQ